MLTKILRALTQNFHAYRGRMINTRTIGNYAFVDTSFIVGQTGSSEVQHTATVGQRGRSHRLNLYHAVGEVHKLITCSGCNSFVVFLPVQPSVLGNRDHCKGRLYLSFRDETLALQVQGQIPSVGLQVTKWSFYFVIQQLYKSRG